MTKPTDLPPMHPKARCEALIAALRAEMPPSFTWDFSIVKREEGCGTAGCALGLAQTIGLIPPYLDDEDHKLWGMDHEEWDETFFSAMHYPVVMQEVTPAMVAKRLEILLDTGDAGKEPDQCHEM